MFTILSVFALYHRLIRDTLGWWRADAFVSGPIFIGDSTPSTSFCGVFNELHRGEVVLVLLHSDHPRHVIEGDRFESEICSGNQ